MLQNTKLDFLLISGVKFKWVLLAEMEYNISNYVLISV